VGGGRVNEKEEKKERGKKRGGEEGKVHESPLSFCPLQKKKKKKKRKEKIGDERPLAVLRRSLGEKRGRRKTHSPG